MTVFENGFFNQQIDGDKQWQIVHTIDLLVEESVLKDSHL
jgi:hypothetical protein